MMPATGAERVGSVVDFADSLWIDFSLWSRQAYTDATAGPDPRPGAGRRLPGPHRQRPHHRPRLPTPTFTAYVPTRPDEATYQRLVTDFLVGVPYVAKSLLRGQLLPAKWVLDFDMRFNYLVPPA